MGDTDAVMVRIQPPSDGDGDEAADMAQQLRVQLLDLDVRSVELAAGESAPEGAKGLGALTGWLAVQLGNETLRRVVGAVASWATRTGHSVEVSIDGDTLKVSGITSDQRERIIDAYLARHAAGT